MHQHCWFSGIRFVKQKKNKNKNGWNIIATDEKRKPLPHLIFSIRQPKLHSPLNCIQSHTHFNAIFFVFLSHWFFFLFENDSFHWTKTNQLGCFYIITSILIKYYLSAMLSVSNLAIIYGWSFLFQFFSFCSSEKRVLPCSFTVQQNFFIQQNLHWVNNNVPHFNHFQWRPSKEKINRSKIPGWTISIYSIPYISHFTKQSNNNNKKTLTIHHEFFFSLHLPALFFLPYATCKLEV